jgi:hypothetical protein
MTDDEIDAALLPMLSKHIGVAETDCRILPFDRLAYRAGMRRAAQIARDEILPSADNDVGATYNLYNIGLCKAACVIERAASDEHKGDKR